MPMPRDGPALPRLPSRPHGPEQVPATAPPSCLAWQGMSEPATSELAAVIVPDVVRKLKTSSWPPDIAPSCSDIQTHRESSHHSTFAASPQNHHRCASSNDVICGLGINIQPF